MSLEEEAMKPPVASDKYVLCLYGEYGKRKTTTACSLVRERGLLISADNSWKVLKRERHATLLDKVTVVGYDGLSQLDYIDYEDYDTIILDTFSKMIDNYLDMLLDKAKWDRNFRETLVSKEKELKGIEVPGVQDYRVVRDQFRPALNRLMDADVHKVFTFHVNDPIEGLSKDTVRRPRVPASTWAMIAELADVIGWLRGGRKGFTISVDENSLAYIGKARLDGVEGEMTIDKFIEAYHNNLRS